MYIFVKVCLGSSYSIAVPDCNDTSSLEACNCIIRANSPVFSTVYFRFRHWAFWTKLIATTRLKTFQYRLVWTCIHKKLIACHSPNFKICVGSRIILPVTLLQPTKTDDRKRSNWSPDVNQLFSIDLRGGQFESLLPVNGSSRETNKSQINTMMKQRWGLDRNVLRPTPGDRMGVEQHHWNTRAKKKLG